MFSGGVYFSHPWADFLLLIDDGSSFLLASPLRFIHISYCLKPKLFLGIFAPSLTRWALGTDVPASIHTFAVLCGNSMTQLFSRLLASHFPHPPGPLGDFKVRKGQRLRFIPWEAKPLSQTVTDCKSLLLQSSLRPSNCISPSSDLWGFDFHSFGHSVRS